MNQDLMILLFGFILLFLGGSLLFFLLSNRLSCKESTLATVHSLNKKKMSFGGKDLTLTQPVFTYQAGEKKYLYPADFTTLRIDKYHVGDQVRIHYNPKKPKLPLIRQNMISYLIGLLLAIPGLALIICYF